MREQQMAGALVGSNLNRLSETYDGAKVAQESEIGSVGREIGKLTEAVRSMEHALAGHFGRIQSVVSNPPDHGNGAANQHPQPPDVMVCDVAGSIRDLRRQLEALTSALAIVTSQVDL